MSIAHAAMFDAVNSIERKYTKYAIEVSPPAGASADAAAITAAHAVLMQLVPDEKKKLDAALTTTLAQRGRWSSQRRGHGGRVRSQLSCSIFRNNDGIDAKVAYTPAPRRRMAADAAGFAPGILPQFGGVTPSVLKSSDQFTLPGTHARQRGVRSRYAG